MKMLSQQPFGLQFGGPAAAPHASSASSGVRFPSISVARHLAIADLPLLVGDTLICSVVVVVASVVAKGDTTDAWAALGQPDCWLAMLLVPVLILAFHLCGHYQLQRRGRVELLQLLAVVATFAVVANLLALVSGQYPLPLPAQLILPALLPVLIVQRRLTRLAIQRIAVSQPATRDGPASILAYAVSPGRVGKRMLDITVAALALGFLSPLLLAVAIFVKTDGGPILFGHTRMGRDGRRFRCLKFRTMGVDAESRLHELLASDPAAAAEWAATQKLVADPRVTAIGAVLRKTSLDELPQLLNVLRGEMSLVGPRPIVEAEVARYGDNIASYYAVRPGVTGLWQVSGRSETSYAHRVELDTSYVRNWSLGQDLAILLKTVPAVLARRGAI